MTKRKKKRIGVGVAEADVEVCDAPNAASSGSAAAPSVVEPGVCRAASHAAHPTKLDTAGSGDSPGTTTAVTVSVCGRQASAAPRSPEAAAAAAAALSRFSIAQALSKTAPTSSVPQAIAPANRNKTSAVSGARLSLAAAAAVAAAFEISMAAAGRPSSAVLPLRLFGDFEGIRARRSVVPHPNRSVQRGIEDRRSGDTMFLFVWHVLPLRQRESSSHGQVQVRFSL